MARFTNRVIFLLNAIGLWAAQAASAPWPAPREADGTLRDFQFASGQQLAELRMHYRTLGEPRRNTKGVVTNAVLILHGTTGNGSNFLRAEFAGVLFAKNQILDASRYFLVLPDNIGHGQSSRPSDGLHAGFPNYRYADMVTAQHRLLVECLQINHLRLVMGTSMGGMHTWLWAERFPDFMDAAMPLASLPTQISGRNRVWRRIIIDAIRNDVAWNRGDYSQQPPSLRIASEVLYFMSSNPVQRQTEAPSRALADEVLNKFVENTFRNSDANNILYAVESSEDYDPGPGLGKIRAALTAVNFADDLINPPELGLLEREIKKVAKGKAVLMPMSPETRGHGTHTLAPVWQQHLAELLQRADVPK